MTDDPLAGDDPLVATETYQPADPETVIEGGGRVSLNRDIAEVPQPLRPLALGEFLALEIPERKMLLGPIIAEQAIAMLFGPRGCGKTHVALGIGSAVATGTDFLRWQAPAPRRVLYIDGEMPAAALKERLEAATGRVVNPGQARQNLKILAADVRRDGLPDLSTPAGRKAFAPILDGFDLLILDNISTLCRSGKENEAEGWGDLQGWALEQRRAWRSVLFLHHAGKGGDQRGTSKREDVMDTVMRMTLPSDYDAKQGARFILDYTKARGMFGEAAESFEASMCDGVWTVRAATSARDEQIIALKTEGCTQREIADEVGCGLATVNRVLKRREAVACGG